MNINIENKIVHAVMQIISHTRKTRKIILNARFTQTKWGQIINMNEKRALFYYTIENYLENDTNVT